MPFSRDVENLIANLRNLPERQSKAREKPAKDLASLLENCFEHYEIGKVTPESVIAENWNQIMGDRFAARCALERIDRAGRMVIQVANPILRRELAFVEDRIMTRVRSLERCEHIRGVVFKAG